MSKAFFSDEELVAFLDGEAEFAPIKEIEEALKSDADLAQRLNDLKVDTALIASSFDHLNMRVSNVPEFKDIKIDPIIIPTKNKLNHLYAICAAACAMLIFVTGMFSTTYFSNTSQGLDDNWKEYVAAYQFLYTKKTLAHLKPQTDLQVAELARTSAALNKNIELASLQNLPSLEYVRSQNLGYKGSPIIQLSFIGANGKPFALCIMNIGEKTNETNIEVTKLEGLSSASWQADGYEFLLIGGQDDDAVVKLSEILKARSI